MLVRCYVYYNLNKYYKQSWKKMIVCYVYFTGYASVSRSTSISTTNTGSRVSEYSETGEDSKGLKFTSKPKSQNIRQGEVAKFTCTVSGISPIGKL